MSFFDGFKRGIRTAAAVVHSSAGWQRDLALLKYDHDSLLKAEDHGILPRGTIEYANEIVELRIQGKPVAKTRREWVTLLFRGSSEYHDLRDYVRMTPDETLQSARRLGAAMWSKDSDMTKGVTIQAALKQLVALNQAYPDKPLEQLAYEAMSRANVLQPPM